MKREHLAPLRNQFMECKECKNRLKMEGGGGVKGLDI
jgi:hypothetical protein